MKWEGNRQSDNVEDRRGTGGGGGFRIGGGGVGLGTVVIALLAGWLFGINPLALIGMMGGDGGTVSSPQAPAQRPPAGDTQAAFVSTVLADTEDVWGAQFRSQMRTTYRQPKLALFSGAVPTACGRGQAAMGPFYCPGDEKVYIDLGFFNTLQQRLGAPGDFAQAYVIAHEVGHHVQHQLGITDKVDARGSACRRGRPTTFRCAWSCRPTAWPACGPTIPSRARAGWSRATSRRR